MRELFWPLSIFVVDTDESLHPVLIYGTCILISGAVIDREVQISGR